MECSLPGGALRLPGYGTFIGLVMRGVGIWCFRCILALAVMAIAAGAATIIVPCAKDTSIFELAPENNLGGMSFMPAGRLATGARARALLCFDLAQHLPPEALLRSARLEIDVLAGVAGSAEFSLHRLLRPWGEGDKTGGGFEDDFFGDVATANEATWLTCLQGTSNWAEPGCAAGADYVAQSSALEMVAGTGAYTFASSGILTDVALWAASSGTNFGWLLMADDELRTGTGVFFGSREDSGGGARLVIDYDVISRPRLQGARVNATQFQFQFMAEANRHYVVQYGILPGDWHTLTEIAPTAEAQTILITDTRTAPARFYRVHAAD